MYSMPHACYHDSIRKGARTLSNIMSPKRALLILLCAVATAGLMLALSFVASNPAQSAAYRLSDLRMARLTNVQIQNASGRRLLRFDTKIVNTGVGRFEVRGSRPSTSTPTMRVTQRIFDGTGGYRDLATAAKMYY